MLHRLARRSDRPQGLADSVVVAGAAQDGWWDSRADGRLQASITRALGLGWLAEFRRQLYRCLTGRTDALFELVDAILCADHAVTSLFGLRIKCADLPNPEPDEELALPDTSAYGTVSIACWRHVHPKIHGDRGYFADWDGDLPIIKGDLVRVQVQHLPDGRAPHNTLWLWHAGPTALALDEIWRA